MSQTRSHHSCQPGMISAHDFPSFSGRRGLIFATSVQALECHKKEQGFLLTLRSSPFNLSLHLAQCTCLSNPAIMWPQTPLLCPGEDIFGYEL